MQLEVNYEDVIEAFEDGGSVIESGHYNAAYAEDDEGSQVYAPNTGVDDGDIKYIDLIASFGKKVPVCSGGCDLDGDEANVRSIVDNGKTIKVCTHCADRVRYVSASSVMSKEEAEGIIRPILQSQDIPSNVFRYLDSPWGRVRVGISTNSFFASSVILTERVSTPELRHTTKRSAKDHRRMLRLALSEESYPSLKIIKRLIDSEFSKELVQEAFKMQSGDWFDFSSFIERLKGIIKAVHMDPLAQTEHNETVDNNLAMDWAEYDARAEREMKADLLEDAAAKVGIRTKV